MKVTNKNIKTNFDSIKVSSYWSEKSQIEPKMHKIHAYPAKFPSLVVTHSLRHVQENGKKVKVIADIFCGCGTTALEAKLNNLNFWGCDINPVATLIARTKSQAYSENKIDRFYAEILNKYEKLNLSRKIDVKKFNPRIRYWFEDKNIVSLKLLLDSIESIVTEKKYHDFFLCAFSNILKNCSRWLTKSIKPQIDPKKIPSDPRSSFKKQVEFMKTANREIEKELRPNKSEIITRNFLNLKFKEPFVDMVVTSPPYATSYEYADLHQLSALWLGYSEDYRDLREGSIGSLYKQELSSNDIGKLNPIGKSIYCKLLDADSQKARSVARYFIDMEKAVANAAAILKKKGNIIFVIGNTKYKGVSVDNARYLVHSLLSNDFANIEIHKRKLSSKILTPYRNSKGRFSNNSRHRKVYGHEFVVIAEKE